MAPSTLLLSLTPSPSSQASTAAACSPEVVGGKAASLAKLFSIAQLSRHVPKSFALTVDFFQPWMEILRKDDYNKDGVDETVCALLQTKCMTLPLNAEQQAALDALSKELATFAGGIAAVRSSAIEEDGTEYSFAGAFETKLGVSASNLEQAIRHCFASRFDARVMSYVQNTTRSTGVFDASFAVIVMEMIDSQIAGVAFSANPLNSDRDELVVDSSYGLGASVVDGSITADRYVYDKVEQKLMTKSIGNKTQEKRLRSSGGIETVSIGDVDRQNESSLTNEQLHELAALACVVEKEYGMPIDIEWAYTTTHGDAETNTLQLKLLQARPITTLFYIDEKMMTLPGEKRILYYDYNVAHDATTTAPFTYMDMNYYSWECSAMMGLPDRDLFTEDPNMPLFKAFTRQYANLSIFLKYMSTEYFATAMEVVDPYIASIFASKDCDRDKYKMIKLPKGVNLCNLWKLLRQVPIRKMYKIGKDGKNDPEKASLLYQEVAKQDMAKLKELEERGPNFNEGLQAYANELFQAISASFELELGLLFFAVLPLFKALDKERREGKSEDIRSEHDALCVGYEGDGLMQMNIEIYVLANLLPESVWQEYRHEDLPELATRIQENLEGKKRDDLPSQFLEAWNLFMDRHAWDGHDQLFLSSPRYKDSPSLLLAKLRSNAGAAVKNPADIVRNQLGKRREVMALHEQRAREKRFFHSCALSKIQKRNACLDHLMWIRNSPKLHLSQICGILRAAVLQVEGQFLRDNRLEQKGDIFHVDIQEVDQALREDSFDLMGLVRPRKVVYERALRATECPMLIDSRCRILKPDPPEQGNHEEGTLIGSPVSPGVATGRVRIVNNPAEEFEIGEVLAATVTSPAWTPLFAGVSAIILQVGGTLQHGALCAREYGKPAVSNIDIHSFLKTGMMVTVDGNTGIVKILEEK